MNTLSKVALPRTTRCVLTLKRSISRGFTLLELLVVMVIIGILAALTLGAFRYAQESAAKNRTVSAHAAIVAALAQYNEKFGEYPEPANPTEDDQFAGKTLHIGGAHMLYQAITADGNSAIDLKSGPGNGSSESDGNVSTEEMENLITSSPLPKSIIFPPNAAPGTSRPRYLVDGWSRPFQYSKFDSDAGSNTTVNPTYDLWSLGPNASGSSGDSLEIKQDQTATASWIKNW
jgi:prepilin-type N-terminal cleavage/methylation domain-containing protein